MNIFFIKGGLVFSCLSWVSVARPRQSNRDMSPRTATTIMRAFHDRVGLIRRLHLYADNFQHRAANSFFTSLFSSKFQERQMIAGPFVHLFYRIRTAQYRTIISSLLADRVALLPTAIAERGIRLPRKDFSGQRAILQK